MGTIIGRWIDRKAGGEIAGKIATWGPMVSDDIGDPIPAHCAHFGHRSFQVDGSFGAGGKVVVEGSNDGQNFHVLADLHGVAASLSGAGIVSVPESAADRMRVRVMGGDHSTTIMVTAFLRRSM